MTGLVQTWGSYWFNSSAFNSSDVWSWSSSAWLCPPLGLFSRVMPCDTFNTCTESGNDSMILFAHVSILEPVYKKTSALCMVIISDGEGSKVWLSTPGGRINSILALSPAICRAKSYWGNKVATIVILLGSFSVLVLLSELVLEELQPANIPTATIATANKARNFFISVSFSDGLFHTVFALTVKYSSGRVHLKVMFF